MDNSLRLITAWLQCCNILEKIPAPRDAYPAALTVVAGDLLFSLMKELTFSYLTSPTSLSGLQGSVKVRNLSQGFFFFFPSNQTFKNTSLFISLKTSD